MIYGGPQHICEEENKIIINFTWLIEEEKNGMILFQSILIHFNPNNVDGLITYC